MLDAQKELHVTSATGSSSAALNQLQASWLPDTTPPQESLFDTRHWVYQLGADLSGKSGNSDEQTTNIVGDMTLVSKVDELRFYGSYDTAQQDGNKTSDETIGGTSYTAFMYDPWGWYVRGELEKDRFEGIDLRTTIGLGGAYRAINTETHTLRYTFGLGYRHESYNNNVASDGSATLDTGLNHHWVVKPWLAIDNMLSYAPALDSFSNYLLIHDSALIMPIGASKWTLRLGLHNDYNSEPAPGRDKLDTTWYTRVLLRLE